MVMEDKQALERTTSVVDAVMRPQKEHDSYELRLIDARHQIMDPANSLSGSGIVAPRGALCF